MHKPTFKMPEPQTSIHAKDGKCNSAAVDSLRGIAAAMVVLYHMDQCGMSIFPRSVVVLGALGVNLFFTLSGFLIARSVLLPATFSHRRFLSNRSLRILPNYFVCCLIMLLVVEPRTLAHATFSELMFDLASHATLMHGWFGSVAASIIGPLWTLSHEWIFYLGMAALAMRLRHRHGWVVPAGLVAISLVATSLLKNGCWSPSAGRLNPICLWSQFAMGMFGALISIRLPDWKHRNAVLWILLVGGLILLTYCFQKQAIAAAEFESSMLAKKQFLDNKEFALRFAEVFYKRTSNLLWFPIIAASGTAMILTAVTVGFTRLDWFLRRTPLPVAGVISYSTYLYHMAVVLCMMRGFRSMPDGALFQSRTVATCVTLFGVYAFSFLTYLHFEKPWLSRKQKS